MTWNRLAFRDGKNYDGRYIADTRDLSVFIWIALTRLITIIGRRLYICLLFHVERSLYQGLRIVIVVMA